VRNHISSILMKLHVNNRVQAAVRAVRDRML
jgi:DNA-binding NarL/FixJ family response regulator